MTTGYGTYRDRCKELCEMMLLDKPDLTMVRGFYHCPMWGKKEHWWLKDSDGNIVDPSVKQFPTKGVAAKYEEFNGVCKCAECGTEKPEEDMKFESNYAFCSNKCLMRFVGL